MTASLPDEVRQVFSHYITTEYTTVDRHGQPITWPVTPYYTNGAACVDVTTGLGYPKKANDARDNPKVALLFSDPTGARIDHPPTVLVQGIASVDDDDLAANRERYFSDSWEKLPATRKMHPPKAMRAAAGWYYTRIYVHVRPERVFVWADGDQSAEPTIHDSHIEEVRSGHASEPGHRAAPPPSGDPVWDERMDDLGGRFGSGVVSVVAPDGLPVSARLPLRADRKARLVRFEGEAAGLPLEPGVACLTVHEHEPEFRGQYNFQVRGHLVREDGGLALVPRRVVGGFIVAKSPVARYREFLGKGIRFRRIAKRELRHRDERRQAAGS